MKKFIKYLLFCTAITVCVIIYYSQVLIKTTRTESGSSDVPYKTYLDRDSVAEVEGYIQTYDILKPISLVAVPGKEKLIRKFNQLKYILQWTSDQNVPFVDMGKGQEGFVTRKCEYTNCFVTSNRSYFDDYRKFDVVAFAGPELADADIYDIKKPKFRSPHQKYVFASIESPDNYPICTSEYNNFFNWTWTYKLDSEVQWGFIVIRDIFYNTVGPRKKMTWLMPEDMSPVSDAFKNKLKTKRVAVAWFVSNCFTRSQRENVVRELEMELRRYSYKNDTYRVDIYGDCGILQCPPNKDAMCNKMIKDKYYFYLAFENSLGVDYVTEKLLRALNNNAVPIVLGGANYSRFLPERSYLNARELGVVKLAEKIYELINNPSEYADYFRWKNHYSYHHTTDAADTNEYCKFCELLNDKRQVEKYTVYDNFKTWWNNRELCKTSPL